jgi:excisionase family DNA binding protein
VDQSGTSEARVTVEEAARLLGIEKGSVKKRIQRGKLRSEKDASGTLYVDRSETVQDKSQGRSETERDELLESKDETISILRDQLREEREARRRADTIIAQLTQANASLAAKVPELEAPQKAADAPETVEEAEDELGAERARREVAESTLREGMAEQRRRREEAERERDELRRQLYARRDSQESPQTSDEQQGRGQPQSAAGGAQESARRPWWRRVFGR